MNNGFFYFNLHDEYPTQRDPKARDVYYSHVFGPFDSRAQAQVHMTEHHPNNHAARFLLVQGEILGVMKNPAEKLESEKRVPDEKNWTRGDSGSWTCNNCKGIIQAVQVAHPVHDGPFPLSGTGECEYSEAGYCPNCDKKPSPHGQPIDR